MDLPRRVSNGRWIASLKKRMPEVDEVLKASQASLEELKKTVPYRTDDTDEEATAAIGELDRMINAARLIELNKTIKDATEQKNAAPKQRCDYSPRRENGQGRLAQVKEREPRVLDNTVFIYPVEQ